MTKIWLPVLILFLSGTNTLAQSLYLNEMRNALSGAIVVTADENYSSTGFGLAYTFNGRFNVGLTYGFAKDKTNEGTRNELNGKTVGGYFSAAIANEARGNDIGFEFALLLSSTNYDESHFIQASNSSFGVGVNLSKKIKSDNGVAIIPQLGTTYFPLNDTEYRDGEFVVETSSQIYGIATLGTSIVIPVFETPVLIIEPALSYDYLLTKSISFSLSFGMTI